MQTLRNEKSRRKTLKQISQDYLLGEIKCHKTDDIDGLGFHEERQKMLHSDDEEDEPSVQIKKKNTAQQSVVSKLSRIRKSFFAAIEDGKKVKSKEIAKQYSFEANRFLKKFPSSPQVRDIYLRKVKSTFRAWNDAFQKVQGPRQTTVQETTALVEQLPHCDVCPVEEVREIVSSQQLVTPPQTRDCMGNVLPVEKDDILLPAIVVVGASVDPDSAQDDHITAHDDNNDEQDLKEGVTFQQQDYQSQMEDCVSPVMPIQADRTLPLATSSIIGAKPHGASDNTDRTQVNENIHVNCNMASNIPEDVNEDNYLDVNTSKDEELHFKEEDVELELAVVHVDNTPIDENDNVDDGNSYDANTSKSGELHSKEGDEKLELPVIPVDKEDLDNDIKNRLKHLKLFNQTLRKKKHEPIKEEPVFSTYKEQQDFSLWYENQLKKKAKKNEVSRIPVSSSHPEEMKISNPLSVDDKTELKSMLEVNFLPLLVLIVQLVFLVGKQDKAHVKCTCERFEHQTHGLSTAGLSVYYCQFRSALSKAMSIVRGQTIRWLVDKLLFLLPAEEKSM